MNMIFFRKRIKTVLIASLGAQRFQLVSNSYRNSTRAILSGWVEIKRNIDLFVIILLRLISSLIPKDKKLWIFGSGDGLYYVDNSKYLFEHVVNNHPDIRAVWLTQSVSVMDELRTARREVCALNTCKAWWLSCRAGVAFYTYSPANDLNKYGLCKRTVAINLWHGAPIKRLLEDMYFESDQFDSISSYFWLNAPTARLIRIFTQSSKHLWHKTYYLFIRFLRTLSQAPTTDYTTALSENDAQIFRQSLGGQSLITGYARNDALITKNISWEKPVITYLPTFRGGGLSAAPFNPLQFGFDQKKIDKLLEKYNATLNIKLHIADIHRGSLAMCDSSRINILRQIDTYELLGNTNILITDYSSVYFDFLLTLRPIIFSSFDFESYKNNDRGFYYNYDEVTPGPKAINWQELEIFIEEYLQNPNKDSERRKMVCERFHMHRDGQFSERIYQKVIGLLGIRTSPPAGSAR